MGAFLEKPATEKSTQYYDERAADFVVAASEMQGWRIDMEDAHCVDLRVPDYEDLSWFAVFDGHGGSLVSKTSADNILKHIIAHEDFRAARTVESIRTALTAAFLSLDKSLRDLTQVRTGEDHSGSTGIGVMMTPTHFFAANCGDSRSILIRKSGVVALSWDHKPYNEGEQKRIEAAGGTVSMRRVNGDLAVSRALGDFVYKQAHTLPAQQQQVTADPDVHVEPRDPDQDEFLVLACDGIWDVFTNEELAAWIKDTVTKGCPSVRELAEEMLDESLKRGSRDNMTVVIVQFPNAPKPTPEATVAWNTAQAAARADREAKAKSGAGGGAGRDGYA